MAGRKAISLRERLFEKIEVRGVDECWPWTGNVDPDGYGKIKMTRSPGVSAQENSHRVVWELFNGRRPRKGMDVMHSCDCPSCNNPRHLSEGTRKRNLRDAVTRGRWNPPKKLARGTVERIRVYSSQGISQAVLGTHFRVSQQQISRIVSKRQWR